MFVETIIFHNISLSFLVEMPTEERRLVAEEGSQSKNTWLQKKEDLAGVGELLCWAQLLLTYFSFVHKSK